jgi:hypothetical protein
VIKSRRNGWARHVARIGEKRKPKRKNHLEDPGIDVRIILKSILKTYGIVEPINLAQDRDIWRAVVHTVMNLQTP